MTLRRKLENIAGALVDLHVGLNRARHFADQLATNCGEPEDLLADLYEELEQMQLEIERLMKEVE